MNAQEIMQQQGILVGVKNQLFEVVKTQLYAPPLQVFRSTIGAEDAIDLGKPKQFAIYKTTGGEPLGYTGDQMLPVQPVDLLTAFANCLQDVQVYGGESIDLNGLKYTERKGGSRIEFSVPIPAFEFKNKAGLGDVTEMNLTVSTGYDGVSTKFRLDVKRLICLNGWTANKTEFSANIRNTKNAAQRIVFNCDEIAHTIAQSTKMEELILALNRKDLSGRAVEEYVNRVFGFNLSEREEKSKVTQKHMDAIMASIDLEIGRTGATLWGVLNGVTHYTNHVATTRGSREDYVMIGTGSRINKAAQQVAVEMLY